MDKETFIFSKMIFKRQLIIIASILFAITSCSTKDREEKLIIFHAGSLSVPFKEIIEAFNVEHPEISVEVEIAGSRTVARKISELNKSCDVVATADYTVIEDLLIPAHTEWFIPFATNEMVIAYNHKSKYANHINNTNWMDVLLSDRVSTGRSDPNTDPCGYRTVLVLKLAEKYYQKNGLEKNILEKNKQYIRPKETDLLALLESNSVDYIFIYKSVALQHDLQYISLPGEIHLGDFSKRNQYNKVSVEISGKTPGKKIKKIGAPMVYAVSIPKNVKNKDGALKFLQFLLNPEKGLKIMKLNGQDVLINPKTEYYKNIPKTLQKYVKKTDE